MSVTKETIVVGVGVGGNPTEKIRHSGIACTSSQKVHTWIFIRNVGAQFKCNFPSSSEVSGYSNVFNFNEILHLNFFNYTLQFVLNYKSLET